MEKRIPESPKIFHLILLVTSWHPNEGIQFFGRRRKGWNSHPLGVCFLRKKCVTKSPIFFEKRKLKKNRSFWIKTWIIWFLGVFQVRSYCLYLWKKFGFEKFEHELLRFECSEASNGWMVCDALKLWQFRKLSSGSSLQSTITNAYPYEQNRMNVIWCNIQASWNHP